jgi:sec-independent protein translocase protein TatA
MKKDGAADAKDGSDPVEGKVVNHPRTATPENHSTDGNDVPPPNRA